MSIMKSVADDFIHQLTSNIEYLDVCEFAADNEIDPDELMKLIESAKIKVYWE